MSIISNGSYFWIDAWIIDKELEFDIISQDTLLSECKEGCKKCIQACPTKALSDSFSMDRGKCVAHLSFYAKNILGENIRTQMGLWLYGCDVCQNVCPLNKGKLTETEDFPRLLKLEEALRLENILEMDEDTYLHTVFPRFWYTGEASLWLWKCNALRAMINSGDNQYRHLIKQYCNHADARLKEIAQWGCHRLGL